MNLGRFAWPTSELKSACQSRSSLETLLNRRLTCSMSHRTRASKKLKTCSTRSSDSLQMIAPRLREAELRVPIAPRFGAGRPGAIEIPQAAVLPACGRSTSRLKLARRFMAAASTSTW